MHGPQNGIRRVKPIQAFSLNLATAGAIVMYDRLRSLGRFGSRLVAEGAGAELPPPHVQGGPRKRVRRG